MSRREGRKPDDSFMHSALRAFPSEYISFSHFVSASTKFVSTFDQIWDMLNCKYCGCPASLRKLSYHAGLISYVDSNIRLVSSCVASTFNVIGIEAYVFRSIWSFCGNTYINWKNLKIIQFCEIYSSFGWSCTWAVKICPCQ